MWRVYSVDPEGVDYFVNEFNTRREAREYAKELRDDLSKGWHTRIEDWRDPQWEAMQREG